MKDELRDFTPDDTSRKTATDWLMKVISGKKPMSFHLNGSERAEDATEDESAVAVEELPRMPLGRLVRDREPDEAEPLEAEPRRVEFTAEDLCGAPAVPVIKVTPAPKNEITADDVCWVPEERRLKPQPPPQPQPQPAVAEEYFPAPKLKIVQAQGRESQRPSPEKEPEFRGAETQGAAALDSEPMRVRGSNEISAEDISRDVAPYMVEPIWGGAAESAFAGDADADAEQGAITAEDICRDWVIEQKQPTAVETRDGVVLPFSFRVLKPASVVEESKAAPAAPELVVPAAAETVIRVVAEPALPVAAEPAAEEAIAKEAAREGVTGEAAEAQVEPAPQVGEPAFASSEGVAADEARIAAPEAIADAPIADVSVVDGELGEVEAAAEGTAEPDQLAEERAWAEARAAEAQIESALREMEVSDGEGEKPAVEAPAESVFAREGYWAEAARAEGATRVEAPYETPAVQEVKPEMKRQLPLPEDLGEIGPPPEGWMSAWKTLLRLGAVLPWVAKTLPMLESASLGEQQGASGAGISGVSGLQEMRQDVSGLRLVQYEIRTAVQDHSMQLKRMEEQLGRVRESLEAKQSDSGEVAESVRSMSKLIRIGGIGLGGLLVVLIVLVMVILAHGR